MKTTVVITCQVEGMHQWPGAADYSIEAAYLSFPHRHIFHIKVYKEVFHDDRDIEFIMFKRDVIQYLNNKYYNEETNILEFENMSCEMIAKELLEHFSAVKVEVWEDNENGAIVEL